MQQAIQLFLRVSLVNQYARNALRAQTFGQTILKAKLPRRQFLHLAAGAAAPQSGQVSQRGSGKSWLDTMAAITIAVAMQPPSHEYHLMESLVSARLFFLDNVETDTPDSVVSLMVVSSDNPPTC